MQTAKLCFRLLTITGKFTSAFIVLTLAAMSGCSTPSAIPETYDLPTILDLQIPLVHHAILEYAVEHEDRLPATSVGEQLAIRAVKERSRSIDELDAAGDKITLTEFIDNDHTGLHCTQREPAYRRDAHKNQTQVTRGSS